MQKGLEAITVVRVIGVIQEGIALGNRDLTISCLSCTLLVA